MLLSEGEMSDHAGAAYLVDALPEAHALIADRGYDSDGYRAALEDQAMTPCIPPRKTRKVQHAYDRTLYKLRHRVENMFAVSSYSLWIGRSIFSIVGKLKPN